MKQFRGDISTILLVASEVLQWISVTLDQYFDYKSITTNSVIRNIHLKCKFLLEALTIVASPLHIIYKIGTDMACKMKPMPMTESEKRITWLNLVRPSLFSSSNPNQIKPEAILNLRTKILAYQPEPVWPSLIQLLLSNNMQVAKTIMANLGQIVPGRDLEKPDYKLPKTISQGCEGYLCKYKCIGAADHTWSQAIGSSIIRIVMHGMRSQDSFIKLLEPLFKTMGEESWECLDMSHIWNLKKPIWFQSISHLMEPHILVAMDHILGKIESKRKLDKAEVRMDLRQTFEGIEDLLDIFPVQVFRLCLEIESKIKNEVRPIADSVLAQLIVSALYSLAVRIQQHLVETKGPRDKVDYMLAFAETLLNLHEEIKYLTHLQTLAVDIIRRDQGLR